MNKMKITEVTLIVLAVVVSLVLAVIFGGK